MLLLAPIKRCIVHKYTQSYQYTKQGQAFYSLLLSA